MEENQRCPPEGQEMGAIAPAPKRPVKNLRGVVDRARKKFNLFLKIT
jgi:hypothetical protein